MNLKYFVNNVIDSLKTTTSIVNAMKKMLWLYSKGAYTRDKQTIIGFKYPAPIGEINLLVRNNRGSDAFIISEVFGQQYYFIPLKNEVKYIMDLGANAGYTAVYYSKLFPDAAIACVEPMPNNIDILRKNLKMNHVNAVVFEGAVSANDGKITMEIGNLDYGNKVHGIPFGRNMNNGVLVTEGFSLNAIIDQLKWHKIDLLKIDIEGYEGVLLHQNNSWLAKVDTIIIEIHEGITIESVRKTTDEFGFIHVQLKKGNWILSKQLIEAA